MASLTATRVDAAKRVPVLETAEWQPSPARLAAAGCVLAFAAALWPVSVARPGDGWILSVLLIVEVALLLLPWGLPRDGRSGTSFWAEALLGLTAPVGALVLVTGGASWLSAGADWTWFVVAVVLGGALIAMSGMDVRGLVRGELAFLMGPTPSSHTLARAFTTIVSPAGEEVVFRAVVLTAAPAATLPLGLLAAVAFVARHHVSPGQNWRGSTRTTVLEIIAAAALLVLTLLSGSIYPALLAHTINNVPMFVLHLQRAVVGGDEE
jgi:hypothetical protein